MQESATMSAVLCLQSMLSGTNENVLRPAAGYENLCKVKDRRFAFRVVPLGSGTMHWIIYEHLCRLLTACGNLSLQLDAVKRPDGM